MASIIHWFPFIPALNNDDLTKDIVGGVTATNTGGVTQGGSGLYFPNPSDGRNLRFDLPSLPTEFSLLFWAIMPDPGAGSNIPVCSADAGSSNGVGFISQTAQAFVVMKWGGRITLDATWTSMIHNGAYHQIVITRTNSAAWIYVDNNTSYDATLANPLMPTNFQFGIGKFGAYSSAGLSGYVKGFQVYNGALNRTESNLLFYDGANSTRFAQPPQYSYAI